MPIQHAPCAHKRSWKTMHVRRDIGKWLWHQTKAYGVLEKLRKQKKTYCPGHTENPKLFFKYVNSKIQSKEGISNLTKEHDNLTENEKNTWDIKYILPKCLYYWRLKKCSFILRQKWHITNKSQGPD